ncbi:DMT family transporter [soil metagenome]
MYLRSKLWQGPLFAFLAAGLFGASTPLAKLLLGSVDPWLLAGLLYLGAAAGLGIILLFNRARGIAFPRIPKADLPWLALATLFGGVLGPVLLMTGLQRTAASTSSLLLNLEGVATSVLAWVAFKEHYDRRIVIGMVFIVAGGIALNFSSAPFSVDALTGPLLIVGACLCWGLDNNFTRKVSTSDALVLTFIKGSTAGTTNTVLAFIAGASLIRLPTLAPTLLLGFLGYGLSVVLFVLALRNLGSSRTGAYFSTAPFIGAILSIVLFHEVPSTNLLVAGLLMSFGVYLHLTETHRHEHTHERLVHSHPHSHDEHHLHSHLEGESVTEGHEHVHTHEPMTHVHAHFPDIHHRHSH